MTNATGIVQTLIVGVRQAEDIEKMPERAPCEGDPQGVLPQLISSLVQRRRHVKSAMKGNLDKARMAQVGHWFDSLLKCTAYS